MKDYRRCPVNKKNYELIILHPDIWCISNVRTESVQQCTDSGFCHQVQAAASWITEKLEGHYLKPCEIAKMHWMPTGQIAIQEMFDVVVLIG